MRILSRQYKLSAGLGICAHQGQGKDLCLITLECTTRKGLFFVQTSSSAHPFTALTYMTTSDQLQTQRVTLSENSNVWPQMWRKKHKVRLDTAIVFISGWKNTKFLHYQVTKNSVSTLSPKLWTNWTPFVWRSQLFEEGQTNRNWEHDCSLNWKREWLLQNVLEAWDT